MVEQFYTVEETASLLKVSKMTIYRKIKSGQLSAYKVGRDYRVTDRDLKAFLKSIKRNK